MTDIVNFANRSCNSCFPCGAIKISNVSIHILFQYMFILTGVLYYVFISISVLDYLYKCKGRMWVEIYNNR